ncbi:MAG TPA: hypothetical protein VK357_05975 [Rubrobacteraceae bacterium]|nr:hypothetical protein [Rubrobacteraceae bacterium]
MPKDEFYTPTDLDSLRMENELLAFEVRFLKAQLAEVERLKTRVEESERSATQLRNRLAEAERAEQDLILLVRRLAKGPLGWFFGSRQNFRILEQRYLDKNA